MKSKYFRPFRNNGATTPNILNTALVTGVATVVDNHVLPCIADPNVESHFFTIDCSVITTGSHTRMPIFGRFITDGEQWAEVGINHGSKLRYPLKQYPASKLNRIDKAIFLDAINKFINEFLDKE